MTCSAEKTSGDCMVSLHLLRGSDALGDSAMLQVISNEFGDLSPQKSFATFPGLSTTEAGSSRFLQKSCERFRGNAKRSNIGIDDKSADRGGIFDPDAHKAGRI